MVIIGGLYSGLGLSKCNVIYFGLFVINSSFYIIVDVCEIREFVVMDFKLFWNL